MKFDLNDISLVPEVITEINSRSNIDPYSYYTNNIVKLPLISAPMNNVISIRNKHFNKDFNKDLNRNKLIVTYPRNYFNFHDHNEFIDFDNFVSYSLDDFEHLYIRTLSYNTYATKFKNILIDNANGHMRRLVNVLEQAKDIHGPSLNIMVGNIANPKTFKVLAEAGADYVRCGIGGGQSCTTSANTSIHYPMGSLINETYLLKKEYDLKTKIVADGGFKNFSDIIKILGLGANYVMIGSILNKSLESDSVPYLLRTLPIKNKKLAKFLFENNISLYKQYAGMSTKEIQSIWNTENTKLKTAEGIKKWNKVEYKLSTWIENFEDYLKSAMSYTNSKNLDEFIGEVEFIQISSNSYGRFNK